MALLVRGLASRWEMERWLLLAPERWSRWHGGKHTVDDQLASGHE